MWHKLGQKVINCIWPTWTLYLHNILDTTTCSVFYTRCRKSKSSSRSMHSNAGLSLNTHLYSNPFKHIPATHIQSKLERSVIKLENKRVLYCSLMPAFLERCCRSRRVPLQNKPKSKWRYAALQLQGIPTLLSGTVNCFPEVLLLRLHHHYHH